MKIVWVLSENVNPWYSKWEWNLQTYRFNFFKDNWVKIIVLDIDSFDFRKQIFTEYKSQDVSKNFEMIHEEITPDVIWIRTSEEREWYFSMINGVFTSFPSQIVVTLATDKWYTNKALSEYQPLTVLLKDYIENEDTRLLFWEELVIKPRNWFWWKWVEKFLSTTNFLEIYWDSCWEYIVQELCDFSKWYQWICDTNHDLRLTYIWGKFSYSELRVTHTGDFRVNVSLWWVAKAIDFKSLPEELLDSSTKIITLLWWLSTWIVSLDFWFDCNENKWMLIELNYSPWFTPEELTTNIEPIDKQFGDVIQYINSIT